MKVNQFLAVATIIIVGIFSSFAQTWTPTSLPGCSWSSFAMSADGNTMAAATVFQSPGIVMVSTNGGVAWITNTLPDYISSGITSPIILNSIAASSDGTKMAGVDLGGVICTSTNSGVTWSTNNDAPSLGWYSIASSADGDMLVAVAGNNGPPGPIYVSTNSGINWLPTSASSNLWRSVACSADGTEIIAGCNPGLGSIYISTNSGSTWMPWMPIITPTNKQWTVACSADGNKMVAAYFAESNYVPGHMFTSVDSGNTWTSNQIVSAYFESVALSADGNKIFATGQDPLVLVSTNFGSSWATNNLPSGSYFSSIVCSADGGKVLTGSLFTSGFGPGPGVSYLSQTVYAPQLNITPSSNSAMLSWLIPSTNFVLQQSSDLASWSDVTNAPVLNFSNLQNQVTLPLSAGNVFFRLATP
jgi:photosystem II stability/assembly factor-like uncharacterized protein